MQRSDHTTMRPRHSVRQLIAVTMLALSPMLYAAEAKIGLSIGVDGEGFFLNPIVNRINVTEVEANSLAAKAGIVAGDEITSIEGQPVKGKRANDLKAYMSFPPGETRTLVLKHANGESFEARLTKPRQ